MVTIIILVAEDIQIRTGCQLITIVLVAYVNSILTGCHDHHCCYSNRKSFKSGIAVIVMMKEKLKVPEIHNRLVLLPIQKGFQKQFK